MARRTREPVLTVTDIEYLKARGWNQTKIADYYGVTRSYVSLILSQHGKTDPRLAVLRDMTPWEIEQSHQGSLTVRQVRDHLVMAALGPEHVKDMDNLRRLYDEIEHQNLVVEYDPNYPSVGNQPAGWRKVGRLPSDGDLIIRRNKHTKDLTEDMEKLWSLPLPALP